MGNEKLCVKPVRSGHELEEFIRMPWRIYKNDPFWVPPLHLERRMHLSKKNPYFAHANCRFWLAFVGDEVVGRISAQVDSLYLDRYQDATGFWGMLEAVDDPEIFQALFHTVEQWLAKMGMKRALGPFNLSINHECGLLIKGFDSPPSMMMGHAPRYYSSAIETLGYKKAKDLIAYSIKKEDGIVQKIQQILGAKKDTVQTRRLEKRMLERELDTIFAIFNDAWSQNWGFVPFTKEEYMDVGRTMSLLARPEFIRIAEIQEEPAGFMVVLPNLNEVISDLDGRLLPFGWARLFWRIRFHSFRTGRILLMGVRRKYQDSLIGAAVSLCLIRDVMKEVLNSSMSELELSWILEDNVAMRRIIEALGAEPYKIYRIYERGLGHW